MNLTRSKEMEERKNKALDLIKQNQSLTLNIRDLPNYEVVNLPQNPAPAENVPPYNQNLKDKKILKENTKEKEKIILPELPTIPKTKLVNDISGYIKNWLNYADAKFVKPKICKKEIFINYQSMTLYFKKENHNFDLYAYLLESFFNKLKNILISFNYWLFQTTRKEFNDPMLAIDFLHFDRNTFIDGIEFMGSECFKKYFLKFLQDKNFKDQKFLFELFNRYVASCYKLKKLNPTLKFSPILKLQNLDLWNFFNDAELDTIFKKIENYTNEIKELDATYLTYKNRQDKLKQINELKDK